MFPTVSNLLLHNQLKFEKGRIWIFGRPSSMLPTDSVVSIQKELEQKNLENLIYFATKKSGYIWFDEMNKVYKLKGTDVFAWGSDIVTLAGWGEALLKQRNDEKKQVVFELKNSVVVDLYGKAENCVDHVFRGLLCGAMEKIYSEKLDCVETTCRAKGDGLCEFLVKPSVEFDFNNPLVKKQLSNFKI